MLKIGNRYTFEEVVDGMQGSRVCDSWSPGTGQEGGVNQLSFASLPFDVLVTTQYYNPSIALTSQANFATG